MSLQPVTTGKTALTGLRQPGASQKMSGTWTFQKAAGAVTTTIMTAIAVLICGAFLFFKAARIPVATAAATAGLENALEADQDATGRVPNNERSGDGSRHHPLSQAVPLQPRQVLYLFFTPNDSLKSENAPGGAAMYRLKALFLSRKGEFDFRPQLIVENSQHALTPATLLSPSFIDSVKAIEAILGQGKLNLCIYNIEGLALAKRFGVTKTPAFVLATPADESAHVHAAYGTDANLDELFTCKKQ